MKKVMALSLALLAVISCTPIEERVTQLVGQMAKADTILQSLAKKEYGQGEMSADMLQDLSVTLDSISNTVKDAANAVAKDQKNSTAIIQSFQTVSAEMKNFLESEISITVENVPSWKMSSAQAQSVNISQKYGEITGNFSKIFPKLLTKVSTKRLMVKVDPDLFDTMPVCQQKFQQLGFMQALTSVPRPVYEDRYYKSCDCYKKVKVGYEQVDLSSCYWQGVMNCGHQMDLRCLDQQIQTQMIMGVLTGYTCSDMTYYVGNMIRGCNSSVPVTKSNALHY